ncbi:MAG TPA: glucose 1-dehydrogenase [Gaiellaceae bacterium]|jgi:3-oxoacyl-[acyl-carrier protein] reductase|nr:glucose 1-dehydrogenase [Gaiellaceae bacterium]
MKDLRGRVAVVTGGAAGIGRGIANVLAAENAQIVVADIDGSAAEAAAAAIGKEGGAAFAVEVDVTDRVAVEAMAAAAVDRFGRIDILAANAGVYRWDDLATLDDVVWDRIMDINVKGALHALQACLPAMRGERYGRIVFTSSITGPVVATARQAHYAASKAAMLGLMRSAALELVGEGITVNAVLPGNVATPGLTAADPEMRARLTASIPLGRMATPEEIGWAVRFFASEESGYVTGQTLVVDGGQVLPEIRA